MHEQESLLQQKNLELAIIEEFIYVLTTCEGHRDVLNTARSIYGMLGAKKVAVLWDDFRLEQELNIDKNKLYELPDTFVQNGDIIILMKFRNNPFGVVRITPFKKQTIEDEERITIFKIVANALSLIVGALLEEDKLKEAQKLSSIFGRQQLKQFFEKQLERSQMFDLPIGLIRISVDNLKEISASKGYTFRENFMAFLLKLIEFNIRSVDFARRYDKNSFLIILPGFDDIGLLNFSDTLVRELRKELNDFSKHNDCPAAKISFRVYCYPSDKEQIMHLFNE